MTSIKNSVRWPDIHRKSESLVSGFTFYFFIYFVIDFFIRFSARFPVYALIRPTLIAIFILLVLLFVQKDKFKNKIGDPVFSAFFILVAYIIFSIPFVEWPGSVLRVNLDIFFKASVFLFFVALFVDTEKRLKIFLFVFLGCQIFRVFEPLYLNITSGYWGSSTYLSSKEFANRLAGAPADVINPNELGFVIATAVPFLHYLLWPMSWKAKALYLFLMPMLLYALILTMSRGGFIALLVVAFFVFKESKRKFRLLVVGFLSAILAFSVMTPVQKERYLSLIDRDAEGGTSADGRIRGMVNEFKLGMTRPIFGHGLGTTPEAKVHKLGSREASHNLYAEVLIELGLVGFFIFMAFLLRIIKKLFLVRASFSKLSSENLGFYARLNKALITLFWMYAVYSINYWGLSQYYWYLFAGLVIAFSNLALRNVRDQPCIGSGDEGYLNGSRFRLANSIRERSF
ncbi:O-antigen ligase family protein [Marinobacter daepoensis]|uniref:O-antigen ligase family protein n=1 Tax=Marinobacter daepoensis TaxID=262077 RepID=UPI001C939745|nr:O-antigen ligase family protein [Marinobacter daepoensis]MBY6032517.1 O-antigen ligase family protein [Marinobacter daepoensis]